MEFPKVINKNHVEFPGVLVLHLTLSEGCNTICGVSRGEALFCLFFKLGFTPCKAKQPLQGMELQEKEAQKD